MPLLFGHKLRVRYAETDQMGVVYHARYLDWLEIGRTEMLREQGMEYRTLEEEYGLLLPVVDVSIQYLKPAHYDDEVLVTTSINGFSNVRLECSYEIRRVQDNALLVTAATKHVWVNRQWRPARIDRICPQLYALLKQAAEEN
ncbi:MAG: thioesterase [Paenibacillaceae bacterium]|jgi:acyl-CoA thioester hydrolase|nr:thioesterase [Paenibacillaceae bacterium]